MTDDPVQYRMDVMANDTLLSGLDREFEPLGGAFRLEAPNGRVALIGWNKAGEPREAGRFVRMVQQEGLHGGYVRV